MTFSIALTWIQDAKKVRRHAWPETMWLKIQKPDEHSMMTVPYIYLRSWEGDLVPWTPTQCDLMSDDWEILE